MFNSDDDEPIMSILTVEEYRDLLAKVGIVHNDCVDDPEVKAWSSKEKCAKWIIGQTASMLHPGLTKKFGNMWLEKWG